MSIIMAVLMAAGAVGAQDDTAGSQPAPVAETTAKPEKPKKICRLTGRSGMHIQHQVCKTQAKWDAQSKSTGKLEVLDHGYKQGTLGQGKPGGE